MAYPFDHRRHCLPSATNKSVLTPAEWRCHECDKLLGVRHGARLHIRLQRHNSLVSLPVEATAVVATLLRNVERDIRRDRIADRVTRQASRPVDDPAVEALPEMMAVPRVEDDQILSDQLAALKPDDARLLRRVFILGKTQEEAGQALGLSYDAARKRYQRALVKLRAQQKIPSALSHSGAAVGL